MKKNILIITTLLSLMSPTFAEQTVVRSIPSDITPEKTMNLQEHFYESPLSQIPNAEVTKENSETDGIGVNATPRPPYSDSTMPLFKQVRIRITNYFRQKDIDNAEKLKAKQKETFVQEEKKETNVSKHTVTLHSKPIDNEENPELSEGETAPEGTLSNTELIGGVKTQVTAKDVILDADTVDFNNETMDITATGKPILIFPTQNVTLKADKIVYNNMSNILKAYDNVEVIKDGSTVYGDYIQVNMNEENALMDNIMTLKDCLTVKAKHATSDGKAIVLEDGKMTADNDFIFDLKSSMVAGFDYTRMLISDEDKSFFTDITKQSNNLNIKVREVEVDAKKNHNVITGKEIELYNGKKHLFDLAHLQIHTNKEKNYFEGNYPELGSRNPMGMFIGPGYVIDVPNGATLKLIPLLNYKSKFGFGGALKYKSATNVTDFMYGSANDVFVLKGKQYLDDKLFIQYGMNAFLDEWFLGARMPRYSIEAVYEDGRTIPHFLGENKTLTFKNRLSGALIGDTEHTLKDENIPKGVDSTVRFRYMAEFNQSLFKHEDRENLKLFDLSVVLQGSAAVYGTGDTQFIGRVGPRLHTQYKYWMQDIGYFASAYQDNTPLTRYDTYRYGHANVYLREAIRLNKYLAVAWSGSANLLKEAPNGKLLQENGFLVAIGPDDFKVTLGYDFVREATFFNITMAMNVKDSNVEFKKMIIKNPDRLSSNKPVLHEIPKQSDFITSESKKSAQPIMQYAEVIEIQDPDREQVQ